MGTIVIVHVNAMKPTVILRMGAEKASIVRKSENCVNVGNK